MSSRGEGPPRLRWLPVAVLALGLLSTAGATWALAEVSRGRSALRFASSTAQMRATLEGRIGAQVSLLRGVAGLFAASDSVDREGFRRYVEQLDLRANYPGVQGVGFSARVSPPASEAGAQRLREAFEARARAMGLDGFRIWPEAPRDEYHSILFLEPLDRRNREALGYDMFTEPARREAMARARDTGQAALSGHVTLVQEIDEAKQVGFLIYLPVYAGDRDPDSVAARRERLLGFVYSPFRADDLFRGIFGAGAAQRVAVAIYDGPTPDPTALLHRSAQPGGPLYVPAHRSSETMLVAGRPWTIIYSSQPAFDATGDAYVAPLALAVGAGISLVLFLLVRAQTNARHEAELAVGARDSFLSVAAHELKTPLTALLGNAQLLQRRAARDNRLSEGERRNLEAIVEGGRRLNRLVNELLDHSRLREERLAIERQPLDLGELVRRVVDEVRPSMPRHSLALRGDAGPLPVVGDPTRLEQVLLNLIGNAAKYSPAGGPIELELAQAERWAVVQVRDYGIGIPGEALPRLFEQYYRAPNALERRIQGMGIGLHVVRELVERHGGTIAVESAEGQGSSFEVRLPLADGAPEVSSPAHHGGPHAPPTAT